MNYLAAKELLGLGDEFDARDVKRAYSRLLKTTRPEDDPQGFMDLRAAYDMMRQAAAWQEQQARAAEAQPAPDDTSELVKRHPAMVRPGDPLVGEEAAAEGEAYSLSGASGRTAPPPDAAEPSGAGEYSVTNPVTLSAMVDEAARAAEPEEDPLQRRHRKLSDQIIAVLRDPEAREDPDAWRAIIRPVREETLDDWYVLDDAMRSQLIDFYNAAIAAREEHPDAEIPAHPIPQDLATGIFQGMDWHSATEADGQRFNEIAWLRHQMLPANMAPMVPQSRVTVEDDGGSPFGAGQIIWIVIAIIWVLWRIGSLSDSNSSGIDYRTTQRILENNPALQQSAETRLRRQYAERIDTLTSDEWQMLYAKALGLNLIRGNGTDRIDMDSTDDLRARLELGKLLMTIAHEVNLTTDEGLADTLSVGMVSYAAANLEAARMTPEEARAKVSALRQQLDRLDADPRAITVIDARRRVQLRNEIKRFRDYADAEEAWLEDNGGSEAVLEQIKRDLENGLRETPDE